MTVLHHHFLQYVKYTCWKYTYFILEWLDRRKCVQKFADDHRTQLFKTLRRFADKHKDVGGCQLVLITQELNQLQTVKHHDVCWWTCHNYAIMVNVKIGDRLLGEPCLLCSPLTYPCLQGFLDNSANSPKRFGISEEWWIDFGVTAGWKSFLSINRRCQNSDQSIICYQTQIVPLSTAYSLTKFTALTHSHYGWSEPVIYLCSTGFGANSLWLNDAETDILWCSLQHRAVQIRSFLEYLVLSSCSVWLELM